MSNNQTEEDMFNYRFLRYSGLYENAEIIVINAGCEEDAFDIVSDDTTFNYLRLTNRAFNQLKESIKKEVENEKTELIE